jgi:hypothetical protein
MKKLALGLILGVLLLAIPAATFAQGTDWYGHFEKGDFSVGAGVGLGFGGWGYGLSIFPGAEYTIADWRIGDTVPLALGVSARGLIGFSSYYGTVFGVGPFVAVHVGFRGLDIPEFFQKFDVYTALGLAVTFGGNTGLYSPFGLNSYGGFNYFLKENLALYLEGSYWGYYGGTTLGVLYKF